jgi:hypothetical protein
MTHPGPDVPPAPGEQPGANAGTWVPPQHAAEAPAEKSGVKKWLPIAGSVALAGVIGVGSLTGWFGASEPEVGDCGQSKGETSFEVVDCDDEGAEFRIVGVEEEKQTYADFEADMESCIKFETAEIALWTGAGTDEGTVYCAEPV